MRLGQIRFRAAITAAIFEGEAARPIPDHSMTDLIRRSEAESIPLQELAAQLAGRPAEPAKPLLPISPPEVWARGFSYEINPTLPHPQPATRPCPTHFVSP